MEKMNIEIIGDRKLGLVIAEGTSYAEWKRGVNAFRGAGDRLMFMLGDWLAFGGRQKEWGEKYTEAVKETGFEYGVLRNARWVSESVAFATREDKLKWAHHREVASLSAKLQVKWLALAVTHDLTVRELDESVKQGKIVRAAEMMALGGGTDDGIFTPHALRVDFERAVRQTTQRLPIEKWSSEMRTAWLEQLAPIVAFHRQLSIRVKSHKESITDGPKQR